MSKGRELKENSEIRRKIEIGMRAKREMNFAEDLPADLVLKDRYAIVCPYCQTGFHFAPSILMKGFRKNQGSGQCLRCKETIQLRIDVRDNSGVAIKYEVPGGLK